MSCTPTEHFVRRTDVELHVGDVELGLVVMLHLAYFLLPVMVHDLPLGIVVILLLGEHVRGCDVRVAQFGADNVRTCLRPVFNGCGDIIGVLKVQ